MGRSNIFQQCQTAAARAKRCRNHKVSRWFPVASINVGINCVEVSMDLWRVMLIYWATINFVT